MTRFLSLLALVLLLPACDAFGGGDTASVDGYPLSETSYPGCTPGAE